MGMKLIKGSFLWFFAAIGSFFGGVALLSAAEGLLSLEFSLSLSDALGYYRDAIKTCFFWFPLVFEASPPQWYMDLFAVNLLLSLCLVKTVMKHPVGGSAVGSTFRFSTLPGLWDWRIIYLTVPYLVMVPYLLVAPAFYARLYYIERNANITELRRKEAFRETAREKGFDFYDKWISDMKFEHERITDWIERGTKTLRSFLRFYLYVAIAIIAAATTYAIDALAPVASSS
ncbi:MAG: hypothetical protein AAFQ19_03995 [Pseudomonadota bacterium]